MKFQEFQRISKNVKTVISKFRENPGKFASIVLQMYWDMKSERDNCLKDIEQLRKALIKTQNLADELTEYQVKYINLTNHIRLKAENNPGVSRYIDLVNYIDRLERD
ncbi:hypothetical protein [Staphylococcus xylosus]|uniref:hypothetical protein n=1 Tax=Staphylococcus xylosus TaxID=1288 RepID=UPI002DBFFF64|nr:hypothetical protein [Staphylococcus xylosus]MEB8099182.1 hypothetical protein [Staphylococcus xylosus]